MGMRRRTRRRAIVAGAAIAHHENKKANEQAQQSYDQGAADAGYQEAPEPAPAPEQYAPAPVDPADQIEHLAQLHASGALTDEEFVAAKAKALA